MRFFLYLWVVWGIPLLLASLYSYFLGYFFFGPQSNGFLNIVGWVVGSPILGLGIWLEQTYGADLRGDKNQRFRR